MWKIIQSSTTQINLLDENKTIQNVLAGLAFEFYLDFEYATKIFGILLKFVKIQLTHSKLSKLVLLFSVFVQEEWKEFRQITTSISERFCQCIPFAAQ